MDDVLISMCPDDCDCSECLESKIKQLEAERKEIFDLAYTIALANIDDRLVDPINRIEELSKALEEYTCN